MTVVSEQHNADIWCQTFDEPVMSNVTVTVLTFPGVVVNDYAQMPCDDCEGTGVFKLPENETTPCVCCKATGLLWVNLL